MSTQRRRRGSNALRPRPPSRTRTGAPGRSAAKPASSPPLPDEKPRVSDREPQALTATFSFDSGHGTQRYAALVRFYGRRIGVVGSRRPGDGFLHEERIDEVVPETGPVSVSGRFSGIAGGEWSVSAELVQPASKREPSPRRRRVGFGTGQALQPATWSWRHRALSTTEPQHLRTRWARLAAFDPIPAVIPGSWFGLIALGVVIGFVFQALLLGRVHLSVGSVLPISLLAVFAGVVGGKIWYIALNPHTWRAAPQDGFCIQGALAGASAVGVIAVALLHLPVGLVLDTTTPGLFLGVAVGRLGCFFTGCCAGRPTASRLGVWCSDRRVGARRIPTQPLESLGALAIGLIALLLFLRYRLTVPGALFVGAMAAYTLCRQVILPHRLERRRSGAGGVVTAAGASLVVAGSAAWLVLAAR